MKVIEMQIGKKTYPTGNPNFSVMQAFPTPISNSDPFLMCDHFGPKRSDGALSDPDSFPVGWHPHRGMDILTYMIQGVVRHADSLGNRESFSAPGMQWISVGSGIEHAEGGGTPAGEFDEGFQIWVNVPAKNKMDPPRYGTEPAENIPKIEVATGALANLLAGRYGESEGPFKTVQDVQMVDYRLDAGAEVTHQLNEGHDNCLVYVHRGSGTLSDTNIKQHFVARLDCTGESREFNVRAGPDGISFIVFAGKRINEPVAWRGPFVMNTAAEIQKTMDEYRRGDFPPVRVPWDYTRIATAPKSNSEL